MEYTVRILLGTYMSFLDDSQTPNAFGWACRFVLGKPATACTAVPLHPHPHCRPFLPSTCHLPLSHFSSTVYSSFACSRVTPIFVRAWVRVRSLPISSLWRSP